MSEIANDTWDQIHAYHDGELTGFARWRFERKMRHEPALQRELDQLGLVGNALRASDVAAGEPDLWDGIALRLPAMDARRDEVETPATPGWEAWLRPAGAVAVAAALTLAVWFGGFDSASPSGGAVRWVDSGGRPVMVLDDAQESGVTIIWMLEDAVEGAAQGVRGGMA